MRPDMRTTRRDCEPLYTGQPARRGMADLRQRRLAGMKLGDTPLVDFTRDRLTGKRCAASAVMNSPPLIPLPAVTEPAPEQPAV